MIPSAKIIATTVPEIEGLTTPEGFVAYCARVSNPGNQMNELTAGKLLAYCFRNKHFSVFEMVNVVMEVHTTRDIARQLLRHRSFSFQEFSQRYADPTKTLGFFRRTARFQDKKNRQNSIPCQNENDLVVNVEWMRQQQDVQRASSRAYEWALSNNIALEQARAVLPEGMTGSALYVNGTLRSWIHYCQVRCDPSTQREHRALADICWKQLRNKFLFLNDFNILEPSCNSTSPSAAVSSNHSSSPNSTVFARGLAKISQVWRLLRSN